MGDAVKISKKATVFIDTNVFKFAAVKKRVFLKKKSSVNWGGQEIEADIHEQYTLNATDKIRNDIQRRDAVLIPYCAYAGICGAINYVIHHEVEMEIWRVKGMTSSSGRFFGCPVEQLEVPGYRFSRVIAGGGHSFRDHLRIFLSNFSDPRFVEISKKVGGFQGQGNPINLNQSVDAFHLWCAEKLDAEYFLTMDYKLKRMLSKQGFVLKCKVVTPFELLLDIIPRLGWVKGMRFLWQGYRFSKEKVSFESGPGWH